mgnify:CR=1 FL=1
MGGQFAFSGIALVDFAYAPGVCVNLEKQGRVSNAISE